MLENFMSKLVNHLKETGFVFPNSQIYGGLANAWDYGPLGVVLKANIIKAWEKTFVDSEPNIYLFDSKILMNSKVWKSSGHLNTFQDILVENQKNGKRYRLDHLINEHNSELKIDDWTIEKQFSYIEKNITKFDNDDCAWLKPRAFNLMFQTQQGVVENETSKLFLRPETAQGIFVNFKNIQRSLRLKLPFGVAQIGKAFRNEITPGNFIFRTREFEQMELEYFTHPEKASLIYEQYLKKLWNFVLDLGLKKENLREEEHSKNNLAHYAHRTHDINYQFPFGWSELMGLSNRQDFDLKNHQKFSKENLQYLDPYNNQSYFPYVIEPSMGVDRLMLAILCDAYQEEKLNDGQSRIILKLKSNLAPFQFAVLPLVKKIAKPALKIFNNLIKQNRKVYYDESGSIGKRYRRQDAIGTPYCITFDYQSLEDHKVTIRNRDTMLQKRINISDITKVTNIE